MTQLRLHLLSAVAALGMTGLLGCSESPKPATLSSASNSAEPQVSDADITAHVKTALLQAKSFNAAEVTVVTTKGDVRLIGMLDSQAQIDDAVSITRAAEGAHTIHNELTIRK